MRARAIFNPFFFSWLAVLLQNKTFPDSAKAAWKCDVDGFEITSAWSLSTTRFGTDLDETLKAKARQQACSV